MPSTVIPGSSCTVFGGMAITPFLMTLMLVLEPSVKNPSRSITVSLAPWSIAYCFISTLPSNEVLLISQCSQRSSACVTAPTPRSICSVGIGGHGDVVTNTVGATPAGNGWSRFATPRVTCTYTKLAWPRVTLDDFGGQVEPLLEP